MNLINFFDGELSVCYNNICVNIKSNVVKVIFFGIVIVVVISGVVVVLEFFE